MDLAAYRKLFLLFILESEIHHFTFNVNWDHLGKRIVAFYLRQKFYDRAETADSKKVDCWN